MKKVFSILLALALLAVAGAAMADELVQWDHSGCTDDVVSKKPTCTSTGIGMHPVADFENIDIADDMTVVKVDQTYFYTYIIPKVPHEYEVYANGVADCNGNYSVTEVCKNCGKTKNTYTIMNPDHHVWGAWIVDAKPTCEEDGLKYHICWECNARAWEIIPALGHDWNGEGKVTVKPTCVDEGEQEVTCTRCKKVSEDLVWVLPALGHQIDLEKFVVITEPTCAADGEGYYPCARECCKDMDVVAMEMILPALPHTFGDFIVDTEPECETWGDGYYECEVCGYTDWYDLEPVGHKMGEWICRNEYEEGVTLGYWVRECVNVFNGVECPFVEDFVGKSPLLVDRKDGLTEVDGEWIYVENWVPVKKTGLVSFEGGLFLVVDGKLEKANGLVQVNDKWYFLANGQVQKVNGFVEYDGAWFYLKDGVLAENVCGLYTYDGGEFVIANGRLVKELNGLWQDPATETWYYFAAGQKVSYTGLAQYNGAWFYVTNGKLDTTFCGEVEYDGTTFTVVNGMLAL